MISSSILEPFLHLMKEYDHCKWRIFLFHCLSAQLGNLISLHFLPACLCNRQPSYRLEVIADKLARSKHTLPLSHRQRTTICDTMRLTGTYINRTSCKFVRLPRCVRLNKWPTLRGGRSITRSEDSSLLTLVFPRATTPLRWVKPYHKISQLFIFFIRSCVSPPCMPHIASLYLPHCRASLNVTPKGRLKYLHSSNI